MAQRGTVTIQTPSGPVDVPVFAPGDSGSSVYEMVRVQTANGPAFVPMTSRTDAAFPYLSVQTSNHGVLAAHDSAQTLAGFVEDFEDQDWTDNFTASSEDGDDANKWSIISNNPYEGSYAVEWDDSADVGTGSRSNVGYLTSNVSFDIHPLKVRFRAYAPTSINLNDPDFTLSDGATQEITIRLKAQGSDDPQFSLVDSGSIIQSESPQFSRGEWWTVRAEIQENNDWAVEIDYNNEQNTQRISGTYFFSDQTEPVKLFANAVSRYDLIEVNQAKGGGPLPDVV